MASFKVYGLNIRIPSEISLFNPPINVPTRALCVQPRTRLPSIQILVDSHATILLAVSLKELHQNLRISKGQIEPKVHLQN
jgi:hypothetical protein